MRKIKFITLLRRMQKLPDYYLCHRAEKVLGLPEMDSFVNEDFYLKYYPEFYDWIMKIGQKYNPFNHKFFWGESWQCSIMDKERELNDKIELLKKELK